MFVSAEFREAVDFVGLRRTADELLRRFNARQTGHRTESGNRVFVMDLAFGGRAQVVELDFTAREARRARITFLFINELGSGREWWETHNRLNTYRREVLTRGVGVTLIPTRREDTTDNVALSSGSVEPKEVGGSKKPISISFYNPQSVDY